MYGTTSQRHPRRARTIVAGVASAALLLTACSGGGSAGTEDEGESEGAGATAEPPAEGEYDETAVIEAGISYPLGGSFDPVLASGAVTVAANWHIFEGLTELDPVTREVYPALGVDLPTQVDDTTYEVDIRPDATFHNGEPVTVEDVVFSFERTADPDESGFFAGFVDFIDTAEAVDEDTVRITTDYPFSLVNERLSVVKIVPQEAVEADPEDFGANPIGTGPYQLMSAVPDDKLVFEKFEDYNGPRPALAAGMNWNLLADPAARATAMTSGTIQAMEDVPYIDVEGLSSQVHVESAQSFGLLFMMFNTDQEPFDDVRVRQAFFYALDMDTIINTGLLGNATAATSFLPENHPSYNPASTQYTYDPEKAKELLADAGVEDLSITLLTTDTGWVKEIAPLLKESFDAVGVSTTLDIGQSPAQYAKVDSGELEVMIAPGDPSVFGNDADLLMRWWYDDGVWPNDRFRWADSPEYEQISTLLDEAVRLEGEEQQATWNEVFDLMSEQVPLYPLFHRQLPTAWDDQTLTGFNPVPTTGMYFLNVGVASG